MRKRERERVEKYFEIEKRMLIWASAPIGAWEFNLPAQPHNQPTDRPTDRSSDRKDVHICTYLVLHTMHIVPTCIYLLISIVLNFFPFNNEWFVNKEMMCVHILYWIHPLSNFDRKLSFDWICWLSIFDWT